MQDEKEWRGLLDGALEVPLMHQLGLIDKVCQVCIINTVICGSKHMLGFSVQHSMLHLYHHIFISVATAVIPRGNQLFQSPSIPVPLSYNYNFWLKTDCTQWQIIDPKRMESRLTLSQDL